MYTTGLVYVIIIYIMRFIKNLLDKVPVGGKTEVTEPHILNDSNNVVSLPYLFFNATVGKYEWRYAQDVFPGSVPGVKFMAYVVPEFLGLGNDHIFVAKNNAPDDYIPVLGQKSDGRRLRDNAVFYGVNLQGNIWGDLGNIPSPYKEELLEAEKNGAQISYFNAGSNLRALLTRSVPFSELYPFVLPVDMVQRESGLIVPNRR